MAGEQKIKDTDRERILAQWIRGVPFSELGVEHGVNKSTVQRALVHRWRLDLYEESVTNAKGRRLRRRAEGPDVPDELSTWGQWFDD